MSDSNDYLMFIFAQTTIVLFVTILLGKCIEKISKNVRNSKKCLVVFGFTYIISVVVIYCYEIIVLIKLCGKSKDAIPYGPLMGVLFLFFICKRRTVYIRPGSFI